MSDLSTTKNNVSCNDNSLFFFFLVISGVN